MTKTPQDHKPKAAKKAVEDIKVDLDGREVDAFKVTVDGVTVRILREAFDDFELLDDMGQLERKKAQRVPSILRRMILPEDFETAMNALRDETTGRVPIEAGTKFVFEVMSAVNPNG